MSKKVLVATEKPFAAAAVVEIEHQCKNAGYDLILLEKYTNQDELIAAVQNVDAMIVRSDKVTKEVIEAAENLKIVVRAGAGYDNLDCAAATEKRIVCMNTPGQNSNAVAELAFGMMIYMARGQFNGKSGTELKGKSIGIHAYGNVGVNVARIAKGFDMKVFAHDPFVDAATMKKDGVVPVNSAEELYSQCDYISLHLPSSAETKNFVNKKLLSMMKRGATLVNTARKEVVCEEGLLFVLGERTDLKYASDIAPDNIDELMKNFGERVYFTPKKMGAQTAEANINAGVAAIKQIIDFFEKGDTKYQVNK